MQVNASVLGLFSGGGTNNAIQEIDLSALTTTAPPVQAPLTAKDFAKMAPWDQRVKSPPLSSLASEALNASRLIDNSLGTGAGSGVRDENDRALFIIHNGVRKLQALASAAAKDGMSAAERTRIQERITKGIAELNKHVAATKLDGALLLGGRRLTNMTASTGDKPVNQYDSKVLVTGASGAVPPAFEGDRKFKLTVTKDGTPTTLNIDLADMGTTTRTVGNVTNFINSKLRQAGFASEFSALESKVPPPATSSKIAPTTPPPTKYEQRLRISQATGEQLSFGVADGDGQPALFVAGAQKIDGKQQSGVTKLTNLTTSTTSTGFDSDVVAAKGSTATTRAMAKGPDGSVYVIADATGAVNGQKPKSSQDVVMMKYDSTGQVVWTRSLGSAAAAQGFSISVGKDGTIAVAGAVDGKADNAASTTGNGRDSFVAAFDKEGRDLWYHQQGAVGSDEASHVTVGDDGTVYVLGSTTESYGGAQALGGKDVYLQGFSATGEVKFTTSLGSAGDDTPAGLVMKDGKPMALWNQSDGPRLASFDAATGVATATPSTLANTGLNQVTSMTLDENGRLFLAGAVTGSTVNNRLVGLDLTSDQILFTKTTENGIRSLTAAGGQVAYATDGTVTIPAAGTAAETTGRGTRIYGVSASDGTALFDRETPASADSPVALTLAPKSSASLEALGIPEGDLLFGDTKKLTDKTALRPGDHFYLAVNGGTPRKLVIAEGETFRTLAAKLNRVLLNDGTAEVRTLKGVDTMVITPKAGDRIELKPGSAGADALKQLGLDAAMAIPRPPVAKAGTKSVSDPPPVIALEIPETSDVSTKAAATASADAFDAVLRRLRIGYREISTDPVQVELRKQNAAAAKNKSSGGSSAGISYYQKQAAAGQDALRRMGISV
ncbi:MAG: hypothetical protein RLZZ157_613 [Pseudomonadota bacterium]